MEQKEAVRQQVRLLQAQAAEEVQANEAGMYIWGGEGRNREAIPSNPEKILLHNLLDCILSCRVPVRLLIRPTVMHLHC